MGSLCAPEAPIFTLGTGGHSTCNDHVSPNTGFFKTGFFDKPCTFLARKTTFDLMVKILATGFLKKPTKLFYGKNVKNGTKVPVRRHKYNRIYRSFDLWVRCGAGPSSEKWRYPPGHTVLSCFCLHWKRLTCVGVWRVKSLVIASRPFTNDENGMNGMNGAWTE